MLMAPQPETVAVLGIGSMGHGMATSALRSGIPTIVWNREAGRTGDRAEAARATGASVLDALGRRTIWGGPLGAGSGLKRVNNALVAFAAEGLGASIALAHRLGVEAETVIDALDGGPLVSPWESAKLQRIAKGDYSPQFALALALKDVHLALEAVDAGRFESLASLAREWERAVDKGLGDQDLTVVTRALEDPGGT